MIGRPKRTRLRTRLRAAVPGVVLTAVLLLGPIALMAPQTLGGRSAVPLDALSRDALFASTLADRGITAVQNDLVADLLYQNLPWKEFLVAAVRDGEAPLWNPLQFAGVPFFAAGLNGALFPSSALYLLMPAALAVGWAALAHLILAAVAAAFLARRLGADRGGAAVAGIAWSLSAPLVTNVALPMIQSSLAIVPLLLASVAGATRPRAPGTHRAWLPSGRAVVDPLLMALSLTLIAVAGHVEMLIYALLVAAAFGAWRLAAIWRHEGATPAMRAAAGPLIAAVGGILLAGVQLVPQYEMVSNSFRSGSADYDAAVSWAFGLRQAATFILPNAFGNPAHHGVLDLATWRHVELPSHTMWGTAWGAKNYVEAAAYVGVLPLLLAATALAAHRFRRGTGFLGGLAAFALAMAFGTPLYRIVFYGLPGIEQLRTPFRWVFAYCLAVAILAGMGWSAIADERSETGRRARRSAAFVAAAALIAGAGLSMLLALAFAFPARWTALTSALVARLPDAVSAVEGNFPEDALFASYQFWNLAHLALFLILGGLVLAWAAAGAGKRRTDGIIGARRPGLRSGAAALVVGLDLWLIGFGFTPAVEPAIADLTPPALEFLAAAQTGKWGRTIGYADAERGESRADRAARQVLWPNTGMRHEIRDIRGYDSIIPAWTADTLDSAMELDGMLRFNRIPNLRRPESLDHPLLAALGARYIMTADELAGPEVKEIYVDAAGPAPEPGAKTSEVTGAATGATTIRIYENERALPRAWVVNEVRVIEDREDLLDSLAGLDPSREVLLEEAPDLQVWEELPPGRQMFRPSIEVRSESRNSLELDVFAPRSGMLVVSEAYFPGWRAWVTPAAAGGPQAIEVPVYRADGMLRAMPVPAGRSSVELRYFPMSVKVGLFASLLGAMLLFLMAAAAAWRRFVNRGVEADEVRRIAVNSVGPIAAALVNKVMLFAFALLYLRVLGPEDNGRYTLAVTVYVLADIITNFGLNLLTAREVARHPDQAHRYLVNTAVLRSILWALALPLVVAYAAAMKGAGDPLDRSTLLALGLLMAALVPAHFNTAISSIFQGLERMVVPAAVTIVSTLLTVMLGALALLVGWGFVGMAGAAIATNWITFGVLLALAYREGFLAPAAVEPRFMLAMAGESLPLMLNNLLQQAFFKIDILLLQPLKGALIVGWYSSAYKWIDALLIVPAYVTMALFPLMSRRALDDPAGLRAAHAGTVRWLVAVALPIAVGTTFLAEPLIRLLGGPEYLPHGARALQIMIWFLPFSFVNGVTQYVLIAMGRQRWITISFGAAVAFNVTANLWAIPRYSYAGAAGVTILSEIVLMVPFFFGMRDLGAPPLLVLAWRPLLAASMMAGVLAMGEVAGAPALVSAAVGALIYAGALRASGWITGTDREIIARLRPGGSSVAGAESTPGPAPSAAP